MRKICSTIMLCLAMLFLANAQNTTDLVTDVIIVRDAPASTKPRIPEKNPVVFSAYAVGPANYLVLSANQSVNAEVRIENLTSGDYAEYNTTVTVSPVSLDLPGSGSYHLVISLPGGDTYSGDFEL